MKDHSKDNTMMRCPGCNVGLDEGVGFNNCAGCTGNRYIRKPEYYFIDREEKLSFKKSWIFSEIDKYTWKMIILAFAIGFLTATLIFK